ncbi:hypothetical protein V7056_06070, partial [Bacillus sp. JJ664]
AVLKYIDMKKFYKIIVSLSNYEISRIRSLFQSIYDFDNISAHYKEDQPYINELNELLKQDLENYKGITKLNLIQLVITFDNIIDRFNN